MLRRLQKREGGPGPRGGRAGGDPQSRARGLARWHPRAASGQVHLLGCEHGRADAGSQCFCRSPVLRGLGNRGHSLLNRRVWALGLR